MNISAFIRIFVECVMHAEKLEDTNWVIRSRRSEDRQYNSETKKDKRTNNHLQNITLKTKCRVTRTPLKAGVNAVPEVSDWPLDIPLVRVVIGQ
jgi:hypothetical protein